MRHGLFMAPYHPVDESPTVLLRRDMRLIEWLDELGFDEAWIGEHHSAGFETIASPEVFIAAVAERTRRIRLGTGVVSLPYHSPLMVANRIIQLDHQLMGRLMFGVGPGLLVSDARMLKIDPSTQRDRMMQSLDVIIRLFRGEEVTETTDWYQLDGARAHLLPYSKPYPEIAVASAQTPSGARAAGKYGLGMLCLAATAGAGFDALRTNWQIANEIAAKNGQVVNRSGLRLMGPMHIAATRDGARANVRHGLETWCSYYDIASPGGLGIPPGTDPVDFLIDAKRAVIGTPDDAVAMIERLQGEQGEFGCFLQQAHDWADWEATKASFELYARHVMPRFEGANVNRQWSLDYLRDNKASLGAERSRAQEAMFAKHRAETEGRP